MMNWHVSGIMVLELGDFNGHVGKWIEGFEGVHGGNGLTYRMMRKKAA